MMTYPKWYTDIEAALVQMSAAIDKRKDYESERSDSWYESEKGEEYQALTEQLEEAYDTISDSLHDIEF